ncbi:nuclear transport factor 2 family protein [Achromobacter spanius]|uniref:nuclear transport factor 2 family protein n=1 Tax=Achromobacter spanius TaxID=217203 RepID=UPI0036E8F49B
MEAKHRAALSAIQHSFFDAWGRGEWQALTSTIPDDALLTSQHGEGRGECDWRRLLAEDAEAVSWMRTSNHSTVVGQHGQAAGSAYAIGLMRRGQRHFLFGASIVLQYRYVDQQDRWTLVGAKMNVNWCKGDLRLASHWRMSPNDEGWQLGDAPPLIVSELDSPWALVPQALCAADDDGAVRQLYSKYSWAIDQGDFALLRDCYTDDAGGGFAPIGRLQGRHAIVGQLKSFRRMWPWMQHFADVVRLDLEGDGQHARMIVARIVPERPIDDDGRPVYGAHYQIRARREGDGQWRICWSDYRPGWFTSSEPPAFDIGVTHA